jgi:glycosyltransferase 2 family protein
MYTMRRYGVPLPVAVTATFISFVATVLFFAIAGPVAVFFGAGRSLGQRGNVLGLSLYDLFLGSLTIIAGIGVLMAFVMFFPKLVRNLVHRAAEGISRRSRRVADRLERLRSGIDQAHESLVAFNSPRGWLALFWATILSGPSHANKLLAGYVALRALGIHANFVDILLVQTLVMFLLYFAPTPGASGVGEVLSAAVMSSYVPRELTPIYILVWRLTLSYFTIALGFLIFSSWVRRGLKGVEDTAIAEPAG